MSTKIYVAYRLKEGVNLWEFSQRIHAQAVKNVKAELLKMYERIIEAADTPEKRAEVLTVAHRRKEPMKPEEAKEKLTPMDAADYVQAEYRAQQSSPYRNAFALDVSIAMRELNGRVYLIPYPGDTLRETLDFLKTDQDLEDYAYWNNTDEPEGMDPKEWATRRDVWHELDKSWQFMLTLEILTYNGFIYLNPAWDQDVIKAWKEKNKA